MRGLCLKEECRVTVTEANSLIEKNWDEIIKKVIKPLWDRSFKRKFGYIQMDYEDFESLAGFEITKALRTYNPSQSNIFTFCRHVISKKANTLIRDSNRDIRKSNIGTVSLNAPILDGDEEEIGSLIADASSIEAKGNTRAICDYFKTLSNDQKTYLFLKELGFSETDILDGMGINNRKLKDMLCSMRQFEKVLFLY